jgi:hypothetical protein
MLHGSRLARAGNVSILLGEFGCKNNQTNTTGRVEWYRTVRKACQKHGFAATVWDDSGAFAIFDRAAGTWDEEVLAALGRKTGMGMVEAGSRG